MKSKYALDPEFDYIEDSLPPTYTWNDIRKEEEESSRLASELRADGTKVRDETITIPGYKNYPLSARMFSPTNAQEELPCVVYYNGGGFYMSFQPHQVPYCISMAEIAHCRVIQVSYRLALDYPFPYPAEDCYSALCWIYAHANELRIDRSRIAVFGDSAGGALAAAVCQMARDRKGPTVCFQMLVYPVTDSTQSTGSAKTYIDTPVFNSLDNALMWELYLRNGDCGMPQYAAPCLSKSFKGLPKAYVELAEFDCLHDEGLNYAKKLQAAGVSVELNETKGSFHGFDCEQNTQYAKAAMQHRNKVMKRALYGKVD